MTRTIARGDVLLLDRIRDLQDRLEQAEETLVAIRSGKIDALVVAGPEGDQVFTLQGADHSFRVLVETMSEGALTVAPDSLVLYGNPRFAEMIGQPPERVEGSSFADYVIEADRPLLEGLIREGLQGTSHGALQLRTMEGRTVPIYFASSRMGTDSHGDAVALCIVVTDLSHEEQNQAMVASERLARSMLDQAGEVIVVCDPQQRVIRASRQAFSMCDGNPLRRQFATVFPLWVQVPGTQAPTVTTDEPLSLTAVAGGDSILAMKGRLRRTDGDVPVISSAVALRGDAGELLGFVVTMTDVSQLETAIKELEAFSYSVAHDLRSPLRAIGGFSRILLDEFAPQLPDQAQAHLRLVSENARDMGQLIDGLLAFSRLGRQPMQLQCVSPTELVRQALSELAPQQARRKLEFAIGDLPLCQGDPILLRQVFVNLLSNAIKFTSRRAEGHIAIGCDQVGGELVYFVRDDGAGFDIKYAHKLFGVFQRLHRAEDYEGTGVGLAIVQRIVRRHGGRIWAEGAQDRGATFSFTLPRAVERSSGTQFHAA
jgi:PAS domain S-box-containing protein